MEFVPLLVLSALIKKIVDTVKYGAAGDVNAVVTQVVAWLAGIAVAFLAASSDFGDSIAVNGDFLGLLNGWSVALVGLNLASTAGIGWDIIKAVDSSNSAVVPNLLARTTAPQGAPGPTAAVREP